MFSQIFEFYFSPEVIEGGPYSYMDDDCKTGIYLQDVFAGILCLLMSYPVL